MIVHLVAADSSMVKNSTMAALKSVSNSYLSEGFSPAWMII